MNKFKHVLRIPSRWLLRSNLYRTGKIPLLKLLTKAGIARGYSTVSTFDGGIKVHVDLDDWIQKQIYFFGVYLLEQHETRYWCDTLKEGDIVLDIGANIGYYSLLASKRVSGNGKIFSFEPVPLTFFRLVENIELNCFGNIYPNNLAISDQDGSLELFIADQYNTGMSSISPPAGDSSVERIKVIARSVDSLVEEFALDRIDFIKIDVEGAEMMVLNGMENTLGRFSPVICIELIDSLLKEAGSSLIEAWTYLTEKGYRPHLIGNRGKLIPMQQCLEGSFIVFIKA
jgi:FkbM family methyltransferase